MVHLTMSDSKLQAIELRAILVKLEPAPAIPVVPDLIMQAPQGQLDVLESLAYLIVVKPAIAEPVVVPEVDDKDGEDNVDEDLEDNEEPKMDLERCPTRLLRMMPMRAR